MIIEYVFLFFACVGALITVGIAFLLHLHFFWLKHLFEEPDRTMAWVKIVFLHALLLVVIGFLCAEKLGVL